VAVLCFVILFDSTVEKNDYVTKVPIEMDSPCLYDIHFKQISNQWMCWSGRRASSADIRFIYVICSHFL